MQNLDVILRLFPDAQIINVVRDGRACVASLKEMSWHKQDVYGTVAAWARAVDDARRAARRLDAAQFHQLRYEDLVAELSAICAFLGEEYDPAMAEPSAVVDVAVPEFKTWYRRTRQPVTTQHVQSRQQRLTPAEIALCETTLGGRLREWGYELAGAPRSRPAELVRYGLSAAPHRLAPARRRLQRASIRLRAEPDVGHDY